MLAQSRAAAFGATAIHLQSALGDSYSSADDDDLAGAIASASEGTTLLLADGT